MIHDPATRTLSGRRWTTKAWIVCACDRKGVRRDVWGRNGRNGRAGWSELFFLDEATALSAGHRPCFYCRRERATAFAAAFARGNRLGRASAPQIDAILHGERLLSSRRAPQMLTRRQAGDLPEGAMVAVGGRFMARRGRAFLPWSFDGYAAPVAAGDIAGPIGLVTPPSTVAALRAGYAPAWHPSAGGAACAGMG